MFLLRYCVGRNQPRCLSRRCVLAAPVLIALGCSMLASFSSADAAGTQRLLSLPYFPSLGFVYFLMPCAKALPRCLSRRCVHAAPVLLALG